MKRQLILVALVSAGLLGASGEALAQRRAEHPGRHQGDQDKLSFHNLLS